MRNIEARYNYQIDRNRAAADNEARRRILAEGALREILNGSINGIKVEKAKPDEDAGVTFTGQHSQIKGDQTDLLMSRENNLFLALQVTTGKSNATQEEKTDLLKTGPFPIVRKQLVPRAVVYLDWNEMSAFLEDHDVSKHTALLDQFYEGTINSLQYIEMKATDPLKKKLAKEAGDFFYKSREEHKAKKKKPTLH